MFVVTPYVPFLAWCRCKDKEGKEGKEDKGDRGVSERTVTLEDNPDRFYQALGISRAMASYQKTESRWWYQTPDGIYWCRISGNTQLAAALLVTRKGLLLAWSKDDNGTGPLPKGSVTAHD